MKHTMDDKTGFEEPVIGEDECGNCRFWIRRTEAGGGYCRRFPPQLTYEIGPHDAGGQAAQYFPYMEHTEWCGEHRRAEV